MVCQRVIELDKDYQGGKSCDQAGEPVLLIPMDGSGLKYIVILCPKHHVELVGNSNAFEMRQVM